MGPCMNYADCLNQNLHARQTLVSCVSNVMSWNLQIVPRSWLTPTILKTCLLKQTLLPVLNRSNAYLRRRQLSIVVTICLKSCIPNGRHPVAKPFDVAGWACCSNSQNCAKHRVHSSRPSNHLIVSLSQTLPMKQPCGGSCSSSFSSIDVAKPYAPIKGLSLPSRRNMRAIPCLKHRNSMRRYARAALVPRAPSLPRFPLLRTTLLPELRRLTPKL